MPTLHSWLPKDAVQLQSIPLQQPIAANSKGARKALEARVEKRFANPPAVNAGDCIVIFYGRTGNGASDNETQVHAVVTP